MMIFQEALESENINCLSNHLLSAEKKLNGMGRKSLLLDGTIFVIA